MSKTVKIIIVVAVLAIAAFTITRCQFKATVNDQTIVDIDSAGGSAN